MSNSFRQKPLHQMLYQFICCLSIRKKCKYKYLFIVYLNNFLKVIFIVQTFYYGTNLYKKGFLLSSSKRKTFLFNNILSWKYFLHHIFKTNGLQIMKYLSSLPFPTSNLISCFSCFWFIFYSQILYLELPLLEKNCKSWMSTIHFFHL